MSAHHLMDELKTPSTTPTIECCYTPLPLDDAAKLAALSELYPQHTTESLITALLHHALTVIETSGEN